MWFPIIKYPVWDFLWMLYPHPGADLLGWNRLNLQINDANNLAVGKKYILNQTVICSHFVNVVLCAAIRNGALSTASDHAYDDIFRICPAQMWYEFVEKKGLWSETDAVFVGLQHKGILDRNIDNRKLGVGLKQPPVPKRGGRPSLTMPLRH